MRIRCSHLIAWLAISGGTLLASPISVQFGVNPLGPDPHGGSMVRFSFYITGQNLDLNQELDIRFDPSLYSDLRNEVGGLSGNFDVDVLQPDNPSGTFGDYSLVALLDNAPWTGTFGVTVTYSGPGLSTSSLPFFVNQLDQSGALISRLYSGSAQVVPEPGTLLLAVTGLLSSVLWRLCRTRRSDLSATSQAESFR